MLSNIKTDHPKAWKEFKKWYYKSGLPVHPDGFKAYPHEFQAGCFCRFFDENEIFVLAGAVVRKYKKHGTDQKFAALVNGEAFDDFFETRPLAETAAFIKACGVLEEKLK